MDSNTQVVVDALTQSMEAYMNMISEALFNLFKFAFCTYNSNGQITGLNFLGSIVILFLGISIIGAVIKHLLEMFTPWHHEQEYISDDDDLMNKTEEAIPTPKEIIIEEKPPKPKEQPKLYIDTLLEQQQREKERLELEQLKAARRARLQAKNK